MPTRRSSALIHCACMALAASLAPAASAQTSIVYNSISAESQVDVQPLRNTIDEIGDDVTLAPGTPRNISSFSLRIFNNTLLPYTGTFTARFYTYSGGLPTNLIWEDDITVSDGEPDSGRVLTWTPNVVVPDQFAWSFSQDVSFEVNDDQVLGLVFNGVQTVGSSNDELGYLREEDGFWPTPFSWRANGVDVDTSWEARVVAGAAVPPPEWNVNGPGSWGQGSNWTGGVAPSGPGATAALLGRVTSPQGATVTLDGDRTVGKLIIANANPYVIAPGVLPGSSLILDGGEVGFAEVEVSGGNHTISARLAPVGDTIVTVAPGAGLSLTQGLTVPAGELFRKSGGGTLNLSGSQLIVEDGGNLVVSGGRLQSQQAIMSPAAFVDVGTNATIAISPGNSPEKTSVLFALFIAGEPATPQGTFDLADNAMVIKISTDEDLREWIRSARANGAWTGKGLTSSAAAGDARGITTVGYALNNDGLDPVGPLYETFGGQPAALNDFLVRYTYNGDADLDGDVDIDDYFHIDLGRAARETGWVNGDFDHSGGVANAADYMLIDRAFLAQGAPLSGGTGPALPAMGSMAAVPEPGAALAALLGAAGLLRRRR